MKQLFTIAAAGMIAVACNTEKDDFSSYQNPPSATSLGDLTISENFNWSSSVKGIVELTVSAPPYFTTEGQIVELIDAYGTVLDFQKIDNGAVHFHISIPQENYKVYARYQNTNEVFEITSTRQELKLAELQLENLIRPGKKSGGSKGKTTATNLILEGDFENSSFVLDTSVYTKLRNSGDWYVRDNNGTITTVNGSKVFTSSNPLGSADLLQSIEVVGDELYDFAYDYSGNSGFFLLYFNAAKDFTGYTTVYTNGTQGYATFLTPSTIRYVQIYGFCKQNDWLDNVNFVEAFEPDDDNDGVSNRQDAYPNNPALAYKTSFPTIGRQTLAFEDLWPAKGDFDFNDMVLSNNIEFRKDANNILVDALVSVKVMALGAGASSGAAIQLLDVNGQPFPTDIIAGISGGSAILDPNVTNGIIVFNDARKSLSPMYNNNGYGPDGEPQEFSFNITFKASAGSQIIVPDFYIFRSNNRGRETHMGGVAGTAAADPSLYNTKSDINGTYKTSTGLPWVIEVIHPNVSFFHHPLEKVDITTAYPKFQQWAESNGRRYVGWMLLGDKTKLYIPE